MPKAIKEETLPSLPPSIPFPFNPPEKPEPVSTIKAKDHKKKGQPPEAV
jgi:hypothetical protein